MPMSAMTRRLLNTLTPGAKTAKLGDLVAAATSPATPSAPGQVKQGVAVPNAAAAPTKAEFDALLTSLRNAGIIAT